MPAWASAALPCAPASLTFLDLLLELCRFFGWTTEQVLDMPVRRFWRTVEHVKRRRSEQAEAAGENPLAALALLLGR